MSKIYMGAPKPLTDEAIGKAADSIGVQIAALKAVIEVESRASAFNADGSLTMLYEPHIAHRYASPQIRPALIAARVASPGAGAIPYPGRYAARYEQFETCARIGGIELACLSTSWGLPQGMGFNFRPFGYANAQEMVRAFAQGGEPEQIEGMCRFIRANPTMHRALINLNWAGFAHAYNGPAYKKNSYDTRLAGAYLRHNRATAKLARVLRFGHKGDDVRHLQTLLQRAGYDLDADGHFGRITFAAVTDYQRKNGLLIDGIVGPQTANHLTKGN